MFSFYCYHHSVKFYLNFMAVLSLSYSNFLKFLLYNSFLFVLSQMKSIDDRKFSFSCKYFIFLFEAKIRTNGISINTL